MKYSYRLAFIFSVAILLCTASSAAENGQPPADNDESYKLPLFIPKAAQPKSGKVVFGDEGKDNDEIYSLPQRAAAKPATLSPSAGDGAAQKAYNKQYEEYLQQMKLYNEQMAEYKKQLAAQQATQGQAPGDNDSSYVLPGQYSPLKKNIKPKPAMARPKAQPTVQTTQPATSPSQQQPQYQAPATTNNSQYYQRYNYSDQSERATPATTDTPSYYY